MNYLTDFCRQIRSRSKEHKIAILLLHENDVTSQVVAILRQELDSMIRVIYLLTIADQEYRADLIRASVEGTPWKQKNSQHKITDREMVNMANQLQGWTESVYKFACGFIHLSNFHDYKERDPLAMISPTEKDAILKHMRYYHGGPQNSNPKFSDLVTYFPRVFEKISENLECYLELLEAGKCLDENED